MSNIVILGGGRVGGAMAFDLSGQHKVKVLDIDETALKSISDKSPQIEVQKADLSGDNYKDLVQGADLVICAVPGFMGFESLRKIIGTGKNVVDISFFPENALDLDKLAKEHNVTAIVDCGVAPGMGNIILGRYNKAYKVKSYECLVGGLPIKREWPYEYKAVFSPIDVIEEYIRPARYIKQGEMVIREALSDPELVEFDDVGTLESFNTDGLRSLMLTMDIPDMIEKTLRYPGSIEYLRVLRESGYFSYDPVMINGNPVRPIDVTAKLLFPKWKLNPGEADFTVMRIKMELEDNGNHKTIQYDLYDIFDQETDVTSMARTTGYTATAVANLILEKGYDRVGIIPPEYVGENHDDFKYILDYLESRNIIYKKKEGK